MSARENYTAVLARAQAREALRAYARRREVDRDTSIIGELAGLIDRAKAAGLDEDTVAECIGQPTLDGA
jgi:hypothetical protein